MQVYKCTNVSKVPTDKTYTIRLQPETIVYIGVCVCVCVYVNSLVIWRASQTSLLPMLLAVGALSRHGDAARELLLVGESHPFLLPSQTNRGKMNIKNGKMNIKNGKMIIKKEKMNIKKRENVSENICNNMCSRSCYYQNLMKE